MGWYYEDFEAGRTIDTPARTVTEADIDGFAGLSGDFNPLHTDDVFARGTGFGGRIAHGPMVIGMAFGLAGRAGLLDETVLGLLDLQWSFKAPVRPGDTLRVAVTTLDMRRTRKRDRGVVTLRLAVRNQHEAEVQLGECRLDTLERARAQLTTQVALEHNAASRTSQSMEIPMTKIALFRSLTGLLLFALGLVTGLVAQTTGDSPQRVEQKRTDLSGAPGMEVIASLGEYKPGEGIDLHIHHGVEAA